MCCEDDKSLSLSLLEGAALENGIVHVLEYSTPLTL